MIRKIFISISILLSSAIFAQLPNTDIWLMDIKKTNDSLILTNPKNITSRAGYDNQPAFSPDGKYLFYTSIREDKQADIYKYDLKTNAVTQFTHTATSEYSPTFMRDGQNISVVMVEPDSTQRLWKFPLAGGQPQLLLKNIDSIGYHCWISEENIALIMITEPPTLEAVNINTGKINTIANNVGRCMYSKDGVLNFIQKDKDSKIKLSSYNSITHEISPKTYDLYSEDFAFINTKEPIVISGKNTELTAYYLQKNKEKNLINLSDLGIKKITRIAINSEGTRMAIVAE